MAETITVTALASRPRKAGTFFFGIGGSQFAAEVKSDGNSIGAKSAGLHKKRVISTIGPRLGD